MRLVPCDVAVVGGGPAGTVVVSSLEIVLAPVDQSADYIWSFPRPNHLAIDSGAQVSDTTGGALREHLAQSLTTTAFGLALKRVRSAYLPA